MPRWDTSTTGFPENARIAIDQAMQSPDIDPIELLQKLKDANRFTNDTIDENAGIPCKTEGYLERTGYPSWDYVDKIIERNIFNLPTDETGQVVKSVRDFVYQRFGYFERTPENIRERVDRVFSEDRETPSPTPDFGSMLRALILANGLYEYHQIQIPAYSLLIAKINQKTPAALPENYNTQIYLIINLGKPPPSHFLSVLIDSGVLNLRDQNQIDALYAKAGKIQIDTEKLKAKGRQIMAELAADLQQPDASKRAYHSQSDIFKKLLEHIPTNQAIVDRMLTIDPELASYHANLTPTRISHLLRNMAVIGQKEFEALFTIAQEELGLNEEDRNFILSLPTRIPKFQTQPFCETLQKMGKKYLSQSNKSSDGIAWMELHHFSKERDSDIAALPATTITALKSGNNPPSVFETVRHLVRAFERANEHRKVADAVAFRADMDELLASTRYRFDELFFTPEQVIHAFQGKFLLKKPVESKFDIQLGALIVALRTGIGAELGQKELAEKTGTLSIHQLWSYETGEIVPSPETFGRIIEAIQTALLEHEKPPISEDAVRTATHMAEEAFQEYEKLDPRKKREKNPNRVMKRC